MTMNRDAQGRILPGSGGRQPGSRNKLQAEFLDELAKAFAVSGPGVIKIVIAEKPVEFLKIIASVLPREFLMPETGPLSELSDEDLDKVIALARASKKVAA
jgi:hypothetical protein